MTGGLSDERTARLVEAMDFQGAKEPEIVDLTTQSLTVRQLREFRVEVRKWGASLFALALAFDSILKKKRYVGLNCNAATVRNGR